MSQQAPIELAQVLHCAKLAHLRLSEAQAQTALSALQGSLQAAQNLLATNTEGIAPLTRPSPDLQEGRLGLHADVAQTDIDRERLMQNAPAAQDGLFLVPRVIE